MDGLSLLKQARAAGLRVTAQGANLVIRGPRRAEQVARLLIDHKSEVMAELAGTYSKATDLAYWRESFEERAAVRQYEAGFPRGTAERLAFAECVEQWCQLNPDPPDPGRCCGCGKLLGGSVLNLPDGAQVHFEPEREFRCLITYGFERKRRAVVALAALGLVPPASWAP